MKVELVRHRRRPAPSWLKLTQSIVDTSAPMLDTAEARVALVDAGQRLWESFCCHGHVAVVRVTAVVVAHVGELDLQLIFFVALEERQRAGQDACVSAVCEARCQVPSRELHIVLAGLGLEGDPEKVAQRPGPRVHCVGVDADSKAALVGRIV